MTQKSNPKNQDLKQRTLIYGMSVICLAFLLAFAQMGVLRWFFAAGAAAIAAAAMWEYDCLLKRKGLFPPFTLSMIAIGVYVFAVFLKTQKFFFFGSPFWTYAPAIVLGVTLFAYFVYFVLVDQPPITNIASAFLGLVYIGIPIGLFVKIMYFFDAPYWEGNWWIVYLILVTKSADIGAFFIGRQFGKRKLALKISPNKTLEGAVGGILCSMIISLLICFCGKEFGGVFEKFTYIQALWLGLIIGAVGEIGDLAESFLKRDAGVKDSNSIPAVGGILDMIDSLLFTIPVVYIFLRIIYI